MGSLCILALAGSAACGDRRAAAPPPPPQAATDAAVLTDGPTIDAPAKPSEWQYSSIRELHRRDCPASLPESRASPQPIGTRSDGVYFDCLTAVPRSRSTRYVHISFMEQDRYGEWHSVSPRGRVEFSGLVDELNIQYSAKGPRAPRECDRIGSELAEYGRAMMNLSAVETVRFGATIQALLTSPVAGFAARVSFRDGRVLLSVFASSSSLNGETYCSASFLAGGPVLENANTVITDIPLAPVPEIDAGTGAQP